MVNAQGKAAVNIRFSSMSSARISVPVHFSTSWSSCKTSLYPERSWWALLILRFAKDTGECQQYICCLQIMEQSDATPGCPVAQMSRWRRPRSTRHHCLCQHCRMRPARPGRVPWKRWERRVLLPSPSVTQPNLQAIPACPAVRFKGSKLAEHVQDNN